MGGQRRGREALIAVGEVEITGPEERCKKYYCSLRKGGGGRRGGKPKKIPK